jgi:Tfp pilus assembly protein PilF
MDAGVELLSLGNSFAKRGELEQAATYYRSALTAGPERPEALCNLGNVLREMGRLPEAVSWLEKALEHSPDFPEALINLAAAREEQGAFAEAERHLRKVIRLRPTMACAYNNLGSVLQKEGRSAEALVHLREALRLDPGSAEAFHNLGVVLDRLEEPKEAIASYRAALRLRPDYADAHLDLGLTLLSLGDFGSGWEEYEWRWRTRRTARRPFARPQWDGAPLRGRTLLVHAEQGLGDAILFLRYVPLIPDGRILCEVPATLAPLVPAPAVAISSGSPLPDFDVHVPLLSLPRLFQTTVESIPSRTPYLGSPDPRRTGFWKARIARTGTLRVGLAWAGSASNSNDATRSMRLSEMAPLAQIPGVSFFSLQKGPAAGDPAPDGLLAERLETTMELEDAAAVIANLDLIISVDTMLAHLAGAMGKPVWTLLSFAADWRWLRGREDSPWYPTMRLFRQRRPGDWNPVLKQVAETLKETYLCHPTTN